MPFSLSRRASPLPRKDSRNQVAIRCVITATTEAFNQHDTVAFVAHYTPDADLMTVRGEVMKGTSEIQARLKRIFDTREVKAVLREIDVSIRFLTRDVAIVHVTNELSGLVDAGGAGLPAHRERSIRVFVRTAAGWKVAAFQNTRLAEKQG